MQLKSLLETVQSFVTIVGIIVGGFWTYVIFIRERRAFPHANIEQRLSHVALSKRANLLHVNVELSNLGTSRLVSKKCIVRVQQILPTVPCTAGASCAIDEVDQALKETGQKQDHFTWPLVAEREGEPDPPIDVEPGETDSIEYEFALPATVEVVRVYSYYRNDRRTEGDTEIGWSASTYYTLR